MKKVFIVLTLLTLCSCNIGNVSSLENHNHIPGTPVEENRVEAKCEIDGYYDLVTYCTEDNVEINREKVILPALGHNLVNHDGIEATCLKDGYSDYETCSRCDYSTYQVIKATGHNNLATREENKIESTCVGRGSYDLVTYCVDDNVEISREKIITPSLGHKFSDWIVEKDPTASENGTMHRDCTRCEKSETKDFDTKICYSMLNFVKSGNSYVAKPVSQDIEGYLFIPSTYNNLPVIAVSGFEYCTGLTYVALQDGIKMIDNYTFKGCSGLYSFVIPNSVTTIGEYAFNNCTNLNSVTLSSKITSIGYNGFYGCSSLVNVYYLGTIGEWCSILFNNNYANPMNYASCFYVLENDNWCELRNIVIPDTVQSINKYQFYGFSNVTSFTFPNSLISIGFSSFYDCKSLSSLEFPSELTSIGEEAFNNCSSLKSVTMGNKLNKIDKFAFENCTLLNKVYYQGLITEWCNISFGNEYSNPMYMASEFYMLNGEQYNKVTSITIPEGIKTIGNYQFCGFKNVTSFNIASDVTTIGEGAFSECKSLTSIVLPDSVVSLLYRAFYNCSNLNRIIMSNKITSIGAFSFYNCTSLASIIIPSSVTFIGTYTFYGCNILTINCEAKAKPSGWDASWNKSNCPVNWGYVVD